MFLNWCLHAHMQVVAVSLCLNNTEFAAPSVRVGGVLPGSV